MEVSFGRPISAVILQLVLVFLLFCDCNLQYTAEQCPSFLDKDSSIVCGPVLVLQVGLSSFLVGDWAVNECPEEHGIKGLIRYSGRC